jgi:hypothetical protein
MATLLTAAPVLTAATPEETAREQLPKNTDIDGRITIHRNDCRVVRA